MSALVLSAASTDVSRAAGEKPLDRRVLVIGDSVMLGAQGALLARLGASGWQVTPVLGESQHTYDAPGVVEAQRAAIGDAVVVSLGTNDGMTPDQFAGWIDDLMGTLRDVRRVYWVNLRPFAEWVPAANATIEAAQERWGNLRVIDWAGRSAPDPGLVYGDGFHLNDAGQAAMAELVGTTLDAFAGEPVTTTTTTTVPATTTSTVPSTKPAASAAQGGTADDGDGDTGLAVVILVIVGLIGAGLLAVGWARRPRGRHSRPRGRSAPVRRARPPTAPQPRAHRPPAHPGGGRRRSR